jgi:hypothetical protein
VPISPDAARAAAEQFDKGQDENLYVDLVRRIGGAGGSDGCSHRAGLATQYVKRILCLSFN